MLIGYSFWGFLGHGITDTPDGGRSHRRTLVDGLVARGHEVVFLQTDRDWFEAGEIIHGPYFWDQGFPVIERLFIEWRWPIPGRNTTPCGAPGHTCDLHRQDDLVRHYTRAGVPTVVWDKDLQLPTDDPLRAHPAVTICEPALHPRQGARSLLFPVADNAVDDADPGALAALRRDLLLSYVGNQYDRDDAFDRFFAPAARQVPHVVAGKWADTRRWPQLTFAGRVPFADVPQIYRRSLATITLLPRRYEEAGQMTQRLFEAVLCGCLPLIPTSIRSHHRFGPAQLHVSSGADVLGKVEVLRGLVGTTEHVDLLRACLEALDTFRLSRQLTTLDGLIGPAAPAHGREGRR